MSTTTDDLESATPSQAARWHPKLTPYRLLTLLTTIVLGGAEAYAVSQNLLFVATSIEWVTSVVIFSMSDPFIYAVLILYSPSYSLFHSWAMRV